MQPDFQKAKKALVTPKRKDYHFIMSVEIHKKLKNLATDREVSVSEIFEEIACFYLREIGKL